jgi:hypothetical protein
MENLLDVCKVDEILSINLSERDVGKLIGKCGGNIKNIRKKFKDASVNINREYPRVAKISGIQRVNTYGYILMFLRN